MTDHEALYRAIVKHPEDDTPRLVYADWLEENDRAEEAEFIRVQCRLETEAPDHPGYQDLLDRQQELRLWLMARVPGPNLKFPAGLTVGGGPEWWKWGCRGFPRHLIFDGGNRPGLKAMRSLVSSIGKAFATIPTRWLVVRFISIPQLAELLKQPLLTALDRITIQLGADEPAVEDAAGLIAAAPTLRNLREAALAFPVGEAGTEALARSEHLASLERLSMDAANLTPRAIRLLASGRWFRGLRYLCLDHGVVSDAFEALCGLDPFTRLHTLELQAALPVTAWQTFARSTAFPRLTGLNLSFTDMSGGQMATFATANGFRLTSLDLDFCSIGNEGARALLTAPWLGSLRRLSLASNRLGPAAVAAIAGCRKLTELKYLDLDGNAIGVRGLRAIAANPALRGLTTLLLAYRHDHNRSLTPTHFHEFLTRLDLPELRYLDLSEQPVGAQAVRLIAGEKFGNLKRLVLDNCKLTDAATVALLASPTLQNLIELGLRRNGLKDGVKALASRHVMPHLGSCHLTDNRIDPDLVRKLARRPGFIV